MTVLHSPIEAATLIADHQRRVDLIEQCANEAGKTEFQRKWLAILQRCAGWFSSMPLNPEIYREPGGAFRCTVETAFYAMRLAGGQKFGTNLPSEKRRRIEPQYNYAVFLAAVCSRLDEPYRHFTIERESDRAAWNPSVNGAVGPWLGSAPYRVARRAAPLPIERMRTGMLAQMLIGSELLTGLDAEVLSELFGAINPSTKSIEAESLLHKVIRQAVDTAVEFDRKAQRAVFKPVQFSVPSAVHVAAQLQPVAAAPAAATVSAAAPASTPPAPPAAASPAQAAPPEQGPAICSPARRQALLLRLPRPLHRCPSRCRNQNREPCLKQSAVRQTTALRLDSTWPRSTRPPCAHRQCQLITRPAQSRPRPLMRFSKARRT
jgi:conjugal transfer pilus assembly protein TraI